MRKCSVCGKVFNDSVRYCDFCGADLLAQRTGTRLVSENGGKKNSGISLKIPSTGGLLIALLVALIVLAVTGTIVFTAGRRQKRTEKYAVQNEMEEQAVEVSAAEQAPEIAEASGSSAGARTENEIQYVDSAPRTVNANRSGGSITYVNPYSNTGNTGNIQYYRPENSSGIVPGGGSGSTAPEDQNPDQGAGENTQNNVPVQTENGIIFPDSSSRLLTTEEIRALTDEDLRMAINEIYARHGYIFRTQSLQDFYEGFSWYVPRDNNMERVAATFNATEEANCKAMVAERERREQ